MRHRNVPPVRSCPGCGGDHHAWSENEFCSACKRDGTRDDARDNAATLAQMAREARLARQRERE